MKQFVDGFRTLEKPVPSRREAEAVIQRAILALTHMWNGPTGKVFVEV
jgi:hypothetical protein